MIKKFDENSKIEEILAALSDDGVVVLETACGLADTSEVAKELQPFKSNFDTIFTINKNAFNGMKTNRVSGLVGKSPTCRKLIQYSPTLEICDAILGPQCSRFQLSFTQAIEIQPEENAQPLHRDSSMYPVQRPGPEIFINSIWAGSKFTRRNGATRFILGSHKWDNDRKPSSGDKLEYAEMEQGSVVIYLGSIWHGGGANQSSETRIGYSFGYTLGWLRQEENQYLATPPEVVAKLDPELKRLIGFSEHFPFLGWYDQEDQAEFTGGNYRKRYKSDLKIGEFKGVKDIITPL